MYGTVYYCQILMGLEFFYISFRNPPISDIMKISPVAAELFHADGQRDRQT
jgi:hypothetical protein